LRPCSSSPPQRPRDWPTYGGDLGATRYSSARQIDRGNVGTLGVAWTYHTGEEERRGKNFRQGASEATPIPANEWAAAGLCG